MAWNLHGFHWGEVTLYFWGAPCHSIYKDRTGPPCGYFFWFRCFFWGWLYFFDCLLLIFVSAMVFCGAFVGFGFERCIFAAICYIFTYFHILIYTYRYSYVVISLLLLFWNIQVILLSSLGYDDFEAPPIHEICRKVPYPTARFLGRTMCGLT